ncbi:Rho-binding antiterminator [Thalassotalea agariperforans]
MITCEHHDYIEIVCTFNYPIKLTMKSGVMIECIALDTKLNHNKVECIKVAHQECEKLIILDEIATLEVCIANPHFHSIAFT